MAGITTLGQVISQLPTDLNNCANIQDDVQTLENWATIFSDPKELAERVATNLFEHYSEIMGDINTAMADWNNSDYYNFGDALGTALIDATGQPAMGDKSGFDVSAAVQVVAGLMDGIIKVDDLNELEQCIQNAETLQAEIAVIVGKLQAGGFENYLEAAKAIGNLINQLPADMNQCKNIQGDLTKLEAFGKLFENPTELVRTLATNLFAHYSEIMGDVHTALNDWNSEQYFNFGDEIGTVLVVALGNGQPAELGFDPTDAIDVVAGIFDGIVQADDLNAIQQCL